ncbi:von Willebrand factor A domain-containing protein 5A-like isoform X2 [Crassostrea virginica]
MDLPKCGLVSVSSDQSVPVKKIDIEVSIQGFIANVRSDLHYINDSDGNLETKFLFPLDSDSAVYKFEAEIDGRTIVAEVQEKSQARMIYQDAINNGHTAMYLSESETAGDLFYMELGNLPARTAAKLSFSYVQELDLSRDKIGTFMLPTVINPRYMPEYTPTDEQHVDEDDENLSSPAQQTPTIAADVETLYNSESKIHLTIHVSGGRNLKEFEDKMELEILADCIGNVMTASKELKPGTEFSVSIHYTGFDKPRTVIEKGKNDPKSAYLSSDILMVSFVPELTVTKDIPCEFIFVIDRSGSMHGDRIGKAKETLLLLLKSLPVNCIFNIVSFGSTYKSLFSKSKQYNEENLKKALKLQKSMSANMGGTEIFKPLENVFKNKPSASYSRQIFLLTDGRVYTVPKIVDLVRKQKNTRIFTFGIGDGCSTQLIRDVAKAGNGKATFVKDNDRLQSKVMSVLRSSMTCGITNVRLDWNMPEDCSLINVPEEVNTIFPGEKNILYAIVTENVSKINQEKVRKYSLKVSGEADNVPVEFIVEVDLNSKMSGNAEDYSPLHRLAAKLQLSEMLMQNSERDVTITDEGLQILTYFQPSWPLTSEGCLACHTYCDTGHSFKMVLTRTRDAHTYCLAFSSGAVTACFYDLENIMITLSIDVNIPCPHTAFVGVDKESRRLIVGLEDPRLNLMCCGLMGSYSDLKTKSAPTPKRGLKERIFSVFLPKKRKSTKSHANRSASASSQTAKNDDEEHSLSTEEDEGHSLSAIVQLVNKQKFDGSWKIDEDLCRILGKPLDKIKKATVVKDIDVWVTAMVVAFFRKQFAQQKAEWTLVEEKAVNWLKTKDLEGKDVLHEALTFLSS